MYTFMTIAAFHLPWRNVLAGNDVTPELTACQYTGQKTKMEVSRQTFVVLASFRK